MTDREKLRLHAQSADHEPHGTRIPKVTQTKSSNTISGLSR